MVKKFNDNGLSVLISTGDDSISFIKTHPVSGAIILDTSVKMTVKQSISHSGTIIASKRHFYVDDKSYPINYINGYPGAWSVKTKSLSIVLGTPIT